MKTLDRHLSSSLDDVRLEAVANHSTRRAGFECPPVHLAAGILHIEEEPGMRILKADLNDHSLNRHRLGRIVGCGKRVMRPRRRPGAERNQTP